MSNIFQVIQKEYAKVIVGQLGMLKKILITLFCDGHVLLEGVPGLAKTETMKTIAKISGLGFSRVQFTPDLLPADILGTQIYNSKTNSFEIKKGPLFANLVLADEINRAPSKIQSALLEAMQEKQITIGDQTFKLKSPYFVIATQNPVEQEGTYRLSEAQVDRFMMRVMVDYPTKEEEVEIVNRNLYSKHEEPLEVLSVEAIEAIKREIEAVYIDEKLIQYIVDIVYATRKPELVDLDPAYITMGASPRASIFLMKAAKAHAYFSGEDYVSTENIKAIVFDVLNHRILLSYEAQAEDITVQSLVQNLLLSIKTP